MGRFGALAFACCMIVGTGSAQASAIPFSGMIASASLQSGIGAYAPVFDRLTYSGTLTADASGPFSITLNLPGFTSDGPGCSAPGSGCSPFSASGTFTVLDDGGPSSTHSLSQTGDILTFSVFNPIQGSISGTLDLGTALGQISADVYAGQAFRADNRADLVADLTVSAVPLPGSAPLFGAALILVGAFGFGRRRKSADPA